MVFAVRCWENAATVRNNKHTSNREIKYIVFFLSYLLSRRKRLADGCHDGIVVGEKRHGYRIKKIEAFEEFLNKIQLNFDD